MTKIRKAQPDIFRKPMAAISLFHRSEAGIGALMAVLLVMAFGALILVPLLGFMITGQKGGNQVQERTGEFYSADAGVESAISWLQGIPNDTNPVWEDNTMVLFSSGPPDNRLEINGDKVAVSIENELGKGNTYRVTSTATDNTSGKSTTIVARIKPSGGFRGSFFGNAITSKDDVSIGPYEVIFGNIECSGLFEVGQGSKIYGDVRCGTIDNDGTIYGSLTYESTTGKNDVGDVRGTVIPVADPLVLDWPTYQEFDIFYDNQTSHDIVPASVGAPALLHGRTSSFEAPYSAPPALGGPAGTNLTINLGSKGKIVELDGNVLVTGNLVVNAGTGKTPGELDLNGQTIYVRGTVYIEPKANLSGAGLIIAIGKIDAKPNLSAGGSKYAAAVVHYDGTWTKESVTETYLLDLNDVWGVSSGGNDTVYAVGNSCEVQKYTGSTSGTGTWSEIDISTYVPTRPNLNGVWGVDASTLYAVGDNGHIVTYNGTWSDNVVTTADLNGVWGAASDNVFAVGNAGTIVHYNGSTWGAMSSGTTNDLHGVWGTSDNIVYAVGDTGTILRYDGTAWSKFATSAVPTDDNLKAVWAGSSSDDVFVVGDGGTILHYNGVKWLDETDSVTTANLRDVYGISDSTVFAVGESGVALKWTALGGWLEMTMDSEVTRDLNGVWGSSSTDVYAVGATTSNFMFFMTTNGTISLWPDQLGQFLGGVAGGGKVNLQPNQLLMPSADTGSPSFPKYRWMVISTYVIDMG